MRLERSKDPAVDKILQAIYQRLFDTAKTLCYKYLGEHPLDTQVVNLLGFVYLEEYQLEKAKKCFRFVAKNHPDKGQVINCLASAYSRGGECELGQDFFRAALINDYHPDIHSNLLLSTLYSEDERACEEEHKKYRDMHSDIEKITPFVEPNINKRLRVGFVSADFKGHSVWAFAKSILLNESQWDIDRILYYNHTVADKDTVEAESKADEWYNVAYMSDDELAQKIVGDKIDILVDLAGHTGSNRLRVFAQKPAPIQVSYIGYPHTTGLDTMDYRLVDSTTDPLDWEYPEKLIRIDPCFLCYTPKKLQEINPHDGFVFGSFARVEKLNDFTVGMWAEILSQTKAKLAIKCYSCEDEATRRRLVSRFGKYGVGSDRIAFIPYAEDPNGHLALYNSVDLVLDPYPYNGTTITCESLSMGVPVVTLMGQSHRSRVSASILKTAGLESCVTDKQQDYIDLAVYMSLNKPDKADIRKRFLESDMCNQKRFVNKFEAVLRDMWVDYCEKQVLVA